MKYQNTMNKKASVSELIPGDTFHPGEFIKDELAARGFNQQFLADKMNISKSEISSVINGRRDINPKLAVLLEINLGISAEFWMNLQVKHDINLIKIKLQKSIKTAKISPAKKLKLKNKIAEAH
jgi:addiction module HigA family antidote